MLPSTGYFKGIICPFNDNGLCERPYCHYRHLDLDESGAILQKLVSAAVLKALQQNDTSGTKSSAQLAQGDAAAITSTLSVTSSAAKATYNPTPIAELNKINSTDAENLEDPNEQRRRHIPVPYTPRKPAGLPIKRSVDINDPKPFIYNPQGPPAKYKPGSAENIQNDKYTPTGTVESQDNQNIHTSGPVVTYKPGCTENVPNDKYTPPGAVESKEQYLPGTEKELPEYIPDTSQDSPSKLNYVPSSDKSTHKKKLLEYRPAKVASKSDKPIVTYQPTPRFLAPCFSSDEEEPEPESKKRKLSSDLNGLDDLGAEFDILDQILDEEKPNEEEKNKDKDKLHEKNKHSSKNSNGDVSKSDKSQKSHKAKSEKHKSSSENSKSRSDKKSSDESYKSKSDRKSSDDKHRSKSDKISLDDSHKGKSDKKSSEESYKSKPDRKSSDDNHRNKSDKISLDESHNSSDENHRTKSDKKSPNECHRSKSGKKSEDNHKSKDKKSPDKNQKSKTDIKETNEKDKKENKHNHKKSSHKSSSRDTERDRKDSKEKHSNDSKKQSSNSSDRSPKNSKHSSSKKSEKYSESRSSSSSKSKEKKSSKEKRHKKSKDKDKHRSEDTTVSSDHDNLDTEDNGLGEEDYDFSDADEDAIALECKRIFEEYVPTEKLKSPDENISMDNLTEEYIPGKKRVSRTIDRNIIVIPKAPVKPDFKVSAANTMAERLAKVRDFHNSRKNQSAMNTNPPISSEIIPKIDLQKPTFSTPSIVPTKIRIAHVPYASTMLNTKKTIASSQAAAKVQPSSSSTVSQTVKKGVQRLAHIPSEKFIDRPGVLEPLASKIAANIRSVYLNMMIDECLKLYLSTHDAYARAQHEELATSKKCSTIPIYKNSAVLAVSRLRKELVECNGIKKSGSDCSSAKPDTSLRAMNSGSWSIESKNRKVYDNTHEFNGAKFYDNIQKWILTEEQLQENSFPRPHESGQKGRAIIYGQNKQNPPKGLPSDML